MSRRIYGKHDTGCHADGAYGHEHVRAVMASILRHALGADSCAYWTESKQSIVDSLDGPMPDDAWDEQAFLDAIREQCTDSVFFELDSGDLVCVLDRFP